MDWKDKFLKLYLSDNTGEMKEALELKQTYLPSKLYRFRPADKIDFVRNEIFGMLYLPFIGELNDPFDSMSLMMKGATASDYFDAELYRELIEKESNKKIPPEVFENENWFENIVDYLFTTDGRPNDEKEVTKKAIDYAVEEMLKKINNYFNRISQQMLRVASFSEKLTNLPMWNHYAAGHKGLCMEYDIEKMQNIYWKNRLFPVVYVPKLPNAAVFIEQQIKQNSKPPLGMWDYFAMHKLDDWSYEKEWRLIINLGHESVEPEDIQNKLDGKGILHWFDKPSRIYFGAEMPEERKEEIKDICMKYNIKMSQMQCTEYGLQAVPIID